MKAWATVQRRPNLVGWIGNVFQTEADADRYALRDENGHMRVVEVEISDPPHEWKRGDWFIPQYGVIPSRIADITEDKVVFHGRSGPSHDPFATVWHRSMIEDATPCDPPDWWEGDR